MRLRLLGIIILAATSAGCLTGETTSTVYIEPDDSISWMILQTDVHSDLKNPGKREREEREYIRAVKRGEHDTVRGFDYLLPDTVETVILRDERPFAVSTTARFRSVDQLAQVLLEALETTGTARLETTAELTRVVVQIDVPPKDGTEQEVPAADHDESESVAGWLSDLEIVLVEGRFVEMRGFRASGDNRVQFATAEEFERMVEEADGRLVLSLAWTRDE